MTSEDCIEIIKNRLIDNGKIIGKYNQSATSISFYVNDIKLGVRPLLTLRLSDHRPKYSKYINPKIPIPSYKNNGNNIIVDPKYTY